MTVDDHSESRRPGDRAVVFKQAFIVGLLVVRRKDEQSVGARIVSHVVSLGGVKAAVDGKRRGLVDHWLQPWLAPAPLMVFESIG